MFPDIIKSGMEAAPQDYLLPFSPPREPHPLSVHSSLLMLPTLSLNGQPGIYSQLSGIDA